MPRGRAQRGLLEPAAAVPGHAVQAGRGAPGVPLVVPRAGTSGARIRADTLARRVGVQQVVARRFVNHLTSMFYAQCGGMVWNGGVCKRRHSNGCRNRPGGCRQHAALRPGEKMLCCRSRFLQCRPLLTVSAFHSNAGCEYVHINATCKHFPCPSLVFLLCCSRAATGWPQVGGGRLLG